MSFGDVFLFIDVPSFVGVPDSSVAVVLFVVGTCRRRSRRSWPLHTDKGVVGMGLRRVLGVAVAIASWVEEAWLVLVSVRSTVALAGRSPGLVGDRSPQLVLHCT